MLKILDIITRNCSSILIRRVLNQGCLICHSRILNNWMKIHTFPNIGNKTFFSDRYLLSTISKYWLIFSSYFGLFRGNEEALGVLNFLDLIQKLLNLVRNFEVIFIKRIQLISPALVMPLQSVTHCLLSIQLWFQEIQFVPESICDLLIISELIDNHG